MVVAMMGPATASVWYAYFSFWITGEGCEIPAVYWITTSTGCPGST